MNAQNYKKLKEAGLVELVKKDDGTVVKVTKSYHPFNRDELVVTSEESITIADIDFRKSTIVSEKEEQISKIQEATDSEVQDLVDLEKDFKKLVK